MERSRFSGYHVQGLCALKMLGNSEIGLCTAHNLFRSPQGVSNEIKCVTRRVDRKEPAYIMIS